MANAYFSHLSTNYTYTSHRVRVGAISGNVVKGRRGISRKGEQFASPAIREVILNRKSGVLDSITVLDGVGLNARRVATLAPDARIL